MTDEPSDDSDVSLEASENSINPVVDSDGEEIKSEIVTIKCENEDFEVYGTDTLDAETFLTQDKVEVADISALLQVEQHEIEQDDVEQDPNNTVGRGMFSCTECDEVFQHKNLWRVHFLTVHTSDKPFLCKVCDKGFSRNSLLKRHMKSHTNDKVLYCNVCGRSFLQKQTLMAHMSNHTATSNLHECGVCNKAYTSRGILRAHMLIHTGDRPYKCNDCKKDFVGKTDLIRHIRVHTGERPFPCQICDKAFSTKSHLDTHNNIHTKRFSFTCQLCSKSYTQKGHLTTHMRHTHNEVQECGCKGCAEDKICISVNEKRQVSYPCLLCDKKFTYKSSLNKHLRHHNGEKRHSCTECNKKFSRKYDLTNHVRIVHTEDKPFKCYQCDKCFSIKTNLKTHIQKNHVENSVSSVDVIVSVE